MPKRAHAPLRIDLAGGWTDVPAFSDHEGGAVVNVTINRRVTATLGDDAATTFTHDTRAAGLGSSAAEHVLDYALRHPDGDLDEIAEAAYAAECASGVQGGRQDQYAACYGGLCYMTFRRATAERGAVAIERLELPEPLLRGLEKRLVLVDSGVQRLSGAIHQAVWSDYARHDDEVTGALLALKQYGTAMRDALMSGDFGGVRHVIDENWRQQKRLHVSVTNEIVDGIFELALRNGAAAGKACGAGGGGALVFYASSDAATVTLKRTLRDAGLDVIEFAFEPEGLTDEEESAS